MLRGNQDKAKGSDDPKLSEFKKTAKQDGEKILGTGFFEKVGVGNPVPGFNPEVKLEEQDGKLFLPFKDRQNIFSEDPKRPELLATNWKDYAFEFEVRFTGKEIALFPYVKNSGTSDYHWYYVKIGEQDIQISQHGGKPEVRKNFDFKASYKDAGLPPVELGKWYTFKIETVGDHISVYHSDTAGKKIKIIRKKVLPSGGRVGIYPRYAFDLANPEVVKIIKVEP